MPLPRTLRRCLALTAVLGVLAGSSLVTVQTATAAPVLAPPSPLTTPATIIVKIVDVALPEAGAARAAGMALETGSQQALNTVSGLQGGINVAKWVPGFKIGYKAGEYIATGLGLYDSAPMEFADGWEPYKDLVLEDPGWFAGPRQMIVTAQRGGGSYTFECALTTAAAGITAGTSINSSTALIQCSGFPGTNPVTGEPNLQPGFSNSGFFNLTQYNADGTVRQSGSFFIPCANDDCSVLVRTATFNQVPGSVLFCRYAEGAGDCTPTSPGLTGGYAWPGATQRGPDPSPTPLRAFRATATCLQADGSRLDNMTFSGTFRENDATMPSPPNPTCLAGVLVKSSLDVVDGVTASKVIYHVTDWISPTERTDWLAENPECWDGQCAVVLEQLVNGNWLSCFTNPAGCENWFDQPNKGDTFRCTQNGKVLQLADCNYYTPTFNPTKVDQGIRYGDPATGVQVKPSLTPMDSPYRQPLGTTVPGATAAETAYLNPSTSPTTNPTAGGTGFPSSGTNTAPAGVNTDGSSCMGDAWSWNPLNWVFVPVKCVMIWAFVPSAEEVAAALAPMRDRFNASAVGVYVNSIGGKFTDMLPTGGEGSCLGPALAVDSTLTGQKTLYPLSTCDEPVKTVASIVKVILTALIWIGVAIALQAMILPSMGFRPLISRERTEVLAE